MADALGREAGMPSGRTVHPAARYNAHGQYDDDRDYEGEIEADNYARHGSGEDVMTMGVKGW